MIKAVRTLVFIACLSSSLAFASNEKKEKCLPGDGYAGTAEATAASANASNAKPCIAERQQKQNPVKHDKKPAEPAQEQNYGRELLGIYG